MKHQRSAPFGEQMSQAMNELRSMMPSGESPTGNGRLTVRTIEVAEPSNYDARKVKKLRAVLNVSQAVFARLVGVSDVLVRSWERGVRQPAPIRADCWIRSRRTPSSLFSSFARLCRRQISLQPHPQGAEHAKVGRGQQRSAASSMNLWRRHETSRGNGMCPDQKRHCAGRTG